MTYSKTGPPSVIIAPWRHGRLGELEAPDVEDPDTILALFSDPYLLEPADPDHPPGAPIGPDTPVQPTPADRDPGLDLETVEARIEAMEEAGLVEALPGPDGEPRYAVTDWLRAGIAPLAAAARVELRHPPGDTAAIAALDVEAAFLLTLPLLRLPAEFSGTCSMAVELDEDVSGSPAGVTVRSRTGAWPRASPASTLTPAPGRAEPPASGSTR